MNPVFINGVGGEIYKIDNGTIVTYEGITRCLGCNYEDSMESISEYIRMAENEIKTANRRIGLAIAHEQDVITTCENKIKLMNQLRDELIKNHEVKSNGN